MRRTIILAAVAAIAAITTQPAHADVISLSDADIGKSFSLDYNGFDGSGIIDGLSGAATLTLTGVTSNSYSFSYSVMNDSTSPITASRISGFGFNTDPTLKTASSTGTYNVVATDANVPNVGSVDVCFKDGGGTNSCAGGGSGGVAMGDTGTGSLTLNFASALTGLKLSDFFVRYQSISGTGANTPGSASGTGSLIPPGGSSGGSSSGTDVPAPGVVLLFGGALAALALRNRRRSRMAA